jgi:hypothetical protein
VNFSNDLEHLAKSGSDSTTGHIKFAIRVKGVSVRGQLD